MKCFGCVCIATLALGCSSAFADDAISVFPANPFPAPKLEQCRAALERGQIIRETEAGSLWIAADDYVYIIDVGETEMRCRQLRYINGGQ